MTSDRSISFFLPTSLSLYPLRTIVFCHVLGHVRFFGAEIAQKPTRVSPGSTVSNIGYDGLMMSGRSDHRFWEIRGPTLQPFVVAN